jgi:hypothetical protein
MMVETSVESKKEEKKPQATKLVIFLPRIGKSEEKTIRVGAITDEGRIDTSRDDVIELSINHECRLRFKDSSKNITLKLVNGEATADVVSDRLPEVAILKAKSVSGKSPLQHVQLSYLIGSH